MEYSQGVFEFFHKGGDDGYDTMQWISKQPWSNGIVFEQGKHSFQLVHEYIHLHHLYTSADYFSLNFPYTYCHLNILSIGISADGILALTSLLDEPEWLKAQFIIWAAGRYSSLDSFNMFTPMQRT
jgi:hypothetical protein